MLSFLQRFASEVIGVLSGFDRVRFRGTKRLLSTLGGLYSFRRTRRFGRRPAAILTARAADTTTRAQAA